ncbi:type III pantothenate kinase 1 [Planctomycetales bacterium]|nr:type III pantothenate kinase 1 [Planctomycetales bacterium]GHT03528.1 type III pantothenate kinase 1 [Planctomycetales bacterium]
MDSPSRAPIRLLIDVGNSRGKFALSGGGDELTITACPTAGVGAGELPDALKSGLAKSAFISSVVPRVNAPLRAALIRRGVGEITFVNPATHAIIPHNLLPPIAVGSDRLLAALAASRDFARARREIIVIHLGSALVIDWLTADGVFQGGLIMPGAQMLLDALAAAAQLPRLTATDLDWAAVGAGRDTRRAILTGAVATLVGQTREGIRRVTPPAATPRLIFTGGGGEILAAQFAGEYAPDLVLRGLNYWAADARTI